MGAGDIGLGHGRRASSALSVGERAGCLLSNFPLLSASVNETARGCLFLPAFLPAGFTETQARYAKAKFRN